MSNFELLDRAAAATTCELLAAGGYSVAGMAAVGIVTGGVGYIPLGIGATMLLAKNYACPDMDLGGAVSNPGVEGCSKVDGYGVLEIKSNGVWSPLYGPGGTYYQETITATQIVETKILPPEGVGKWGIYVRWKHLNGEQEFFSRTLDTEVEAQAVKWRLDPTEGECIANSDDLPPLPPEMTQPISYTDETTNCNFNLTLQGFAEPVPGGPVRPVYLMQQAGEERNEGGRMGGCNWPDTIFMPSDGGGGSDGPNGPVYLPVPDGPTPPDGPGGVPWWAAPLLGGATNAALQLIGNGLKDALGPKLPEGSFTLTAPCDEDEQGQPLTQTWTYPEQKWEERSIAHQITMLEALQTHLNWKTPICPPENEKPPLEGQWVTTRWLSDEKMDHSGVRLRKLFRYRTKSTRNLGQLSAYWAAFTWKAGEVIVWHEGAWWGTPKVWAESEDEGRRVIRFAAAEAGLDPDQVGEWRISSSRAPRYGMSGTMRIHLKEGFPWVSSRESDSWPNVLAKQHGS